ncbi:hypothetical protein [Paenibacillus sp. LK1]|uniref:hypothetical protein n=1 Tax=Paenibacillus sp. LK1 TaxID=2053014 RepID=UPI000C19BF23|nr:hypothetical protein [Paenibacillus sp. LK1]PIH57519.1 hypothetical protein CS562_20155 [Paenibacillus sp. LK1]
MTVLREKKEERDGGYYAVKGFLYQFDMTIKEVLKNPLQDVLFEQVQDISYEDFIIQVKHKESQVYSPSKIKKPIIQLLDLHKENDRKKYRLHCYFKNTVRHTKKLSINELDIILSDKSSAYSVPQKNKFIESFILCYTDDFVTQFDEVITMIKSQYGLRDNESAIIHHAMIRSHLLQLAINKDKEKRYINKLKLDVYVEDAKKLFFDLGYSNYLGKEKYERYLKSKYFTVGLNLFNLQRLFIIDFEDEIDNSIILTIMARIISKYKRSSKSPPPIFCFRKLSKDRIDKLKQLIFDNGEKFNDGTYFDGDRFRIERFTEKSEDCKFKIIGAKDFCELLSASYINQIFHFYLKEYDDIQAGSHNIVHIHLDEITQIIKII